jgi:hypothetical protein
MHGSGLKPSAALTACAAFLVSTIVGTAFAQAPAAPAAAAPGAPGAGAPAAAAARPAAPAPAPIPRTPDGKVSLAGLWVGGVGLPSGNEPNFAGRRNSWASFEEDNAILRLLNNRRAPGADGIMPLPNFPQYLPEHWETVNDNDFWGNWRDPRHRCMPEGLPRIGAPAEIIQIADQNLIIFRYNTGFTGRTEHRVIPTDGRPHNPLLVAAEGWYGSSVGRWEGDTLVIETVGFTNESWLSKSGYPHGYNMKVTERLTRPTATTLRWQATVEDPDYLYEPWTMDPVTRNLNANPNAILGEDLPCWDFEPIVSHTRSG